ncbi:MAG: hypothetical protein MK212_17365 [Saprospiraceae bacterium]|nr:hypothetical protein [Saprospiraceae bacterium]
MTFLWKLWETLDIGQKKVITKVLPTLSQKNSSVLKLFEALKKYPKLDEEQLKEKFKKAKWASHWTKTKKTLSDLILQILSLHHNQYPALQALEQLKQAYLLQKILGLRREAFQKLETNKLQLEKLSSFSGINLLNLELEELFIRNSGLHKIDLNPEKFKTLQDTWWACLAKEYEFLEHKILRAEVDFFNRYMNDRKSLHKFIEPVYQNLPDIPKYNKSLDANLWMKRIYFNSIQDKENVLNISARMLKIPNQYTDDKINHYSNAIFYALKYDAPEQALKWIQEVKILSSSAKLKDSFYTQIRILQQELLYHINYPQLDIRDEINSLLEKSLVLLEHKTQPMGQTHFFYIKHLIMLLAYIYQNPMFIDLLQDFLADSDAKKDSSLYYNCLFFEYIYLYDLGHFEILLYKKKNLKRSRYIHLAEDNFLDLKEFLDISTLVNEHKRSERFLAFAQKQLEKRKQQNALRIVTFDIVKWIQATLKNQSLLEYLSHENT